MPYRKMIFLLVTLFLLQVACVYGAAKEWGEEKITLEMKFEEGQRMEWSYQESSLSPKIYTEVITIPNSVFFRFSNENFEINRLLEKEVFIRGPLPGISYSPLGGMRRFDASNATVFFNAIVQHVQPKYNVIIPTEEFNHITEQLNAHSIKFEKPEGLNVTLTQKDKCALAERLKDPKMALELAYTGDFFLNHSAGISEWVLNAFQYTNESDYDSLVAEINSRELPTSELTVYNGFLYTSGSILQAIKSIKWFKNFRASRVSINESLAYAMEKYLVDNPYIETIKLTSDRENLWHIHQSCDLILGNIFQHTIVTPLV